MLKAGETEREIVRKAVEEKLSKKLITVGNKRRVFADPEGEIYWVLVGVGTWHGFTRDDAEGVDIKKDPKLIIGKVEDEEIDVFIGSLRPLILEMDRLPQRSGRPCFNIDINGSGLHIREFTSRKGPHLRWLLTVADK